MGVLGVQLCSLLTNRRYREFLSSFYQIYSPKTPRTGRLSRPWVSAPDAVASFCAFYAITVYGLALLDILQTVMVTADAFHWFVYGFSNPIQLDEPFLNSWDVPIIGSVISLIVQAYYCWRIYFLRKGVVIPVLILIVSPSLLRFIEFTEPPRYR